MENRRLSVIFSLILQYMLVGNCQNESVTVSPAGFNASEGSIVTFTCRVSSSAVTNNILVDGNNLPDEEKQRRGIGPTMNINETVSTVTIQASPVNNNITLSCLTNVRTAEGNLITVESSGVPAVLLVQGILSPPLPLDLNSSSPNSKKLFWNPPFTLDITDQDPDITGYRVCMNLTENLFCVKTEDTIYEFPNIRILLQLSVTALNVVGESNASIVFHQPCDQDTAPALTDVEMVRVSLSLVSGGNYSITVMIQLPPSTTCYDAYSLELTANQSLPNGTNNIGPLLPVIVDPTIQTLKIEEQIELEENTVYMSRLIAVNENGEMASNGSILFSTYDVQGVTFVPLAGGFRISCSFLDGSVNSACLVTVCQQEEEGREMDSQTCRNVTLDRATPSRDLIDMDVGVYAITEVAVERDGNITIISNLSVFRLMKVRINTTEIPTIPNNTVLTGGNSPSEDDNVGIIVGIIAIVLIVLLVIGTVAVFIFIWKRQQRTGKMKFDRRDLTANEGIDGSSKSELSTQSTNRVPNPHKNENDTAYEIISEDDNPLYTSVTQKSDSGSAQRKIEIDLSVNISPEIIPPPLEFEDPQKTLSQESVLESEPVYRELEEVNSIVSSQESLLSRSSQHENHKYAQLDLNKKKAKTPRDKTGVFYSEIKVEEIPPVLPQKMSVKGRVGDDMPLEAEPSSRDNDTIGYHV